jgi:hypothetical protein
VIPNDQAGSVGSVGGVPRVRVSLLLARGEDMTRLLDTLLVCGVATILIVRTELWLTNYPQLGGRGLHIAHLLWGGLLMLAALVIALAFVIATTRQIAAVIGGIGLGLFIDEVGKFVTADNNYFFRPTPAIIYCFFVAFFLVIRQLDRARAYTQREYLLNAIEQVKAAAVGKLDEADRERALALLARADRTDPLVPRVERILNEAPARPAGPPGAATRLVGRVRTWFFDVVDRPWFPTAVAAFFGVWTVASLVQIVGLVVYTTAGLSTTEVFRLGNDITNDPLGEGELDFLEFANLASALIATGFALAGMYLIVKGRRAAAFAMFERSLLVSIFFTQVFAFVHSQFAAVLGLLADLLLFVAVRAILSRELEREALGGQAGGSYGRSTATSAFPP